MKKIICIFFSVICLFNSVYAFYEDASEDVSEFIVETTASVSVPNLNAKSAILFDSTYGRILYEKNAKERRANASTTKMITAMVAYENCDLNEIVVVSQKAANTGGSSINLRKNDKISLDCLIKGLLMRSGNDASVAIAEHISGSVEKFAELMNEKLDEIGAKDTHFVTPHGLDNEGHYSTAYDLVLIADSFLEIPYLADIVSKKSIDITINGNMRTIGTTNEMLSVYEGANGVKTGFTGNAGRCIVTSSVRDGRRLISVVMGCDTKNNRTRDSINLLNYGYNVFKVVELKDYLRENICISVEKSREGIYRLSKDIKLKYPIKEDEISKLKFKYNIKPNLVAPLRKNESVGNVEISLNGDIIGEVNYLLPDNIERKGWKDFFYEIWNMKFSENNLIEI